MYIINKYFIKKVTERITFEKGIPCFIRKVYRKLSNFFAGKKSISSVNIPDEFLIMLKFCLSKYELMLLKKLKIILEQKQNFSNIDSDQWETFVNHLEYQNSYKFIEMDCKTTDIKIFQDEVCEIEKVKKKAGKYNKEFQDILNSSIFQKEFSENIDDEKEFLEFLDDLILDFINYFNPIFKKIQHKDITIQHTQDVKDLIYLLDDLLIVMNMNEIFIWNFEKPLNFNKFFEDRNHIYEQSYQIILDRVLLVYEYFAKFPNENN